MNDPAEEITSLTIQMPWLRDAAASNDWERMIYRLEKIVELGSIALAKCNANAYERDLIKRLDEERAARQAQLQALLPVEDE